MKLGQRVVLLRDGAVEQVGPPLEIYRRPATLFAARFLGSPPMNVMPATVTGSGDALELDGLGMTLRPGSLDGFRPGDRVMAGIRPQDVEVVAAPAAGATEELPAVADVVEPAGAELHVHLHAEARPERRFVAVVPAESEIAPEDRVGLRLRRDRVHVFAAE